MTNESPHSRKLLFLALAVALVWPPVYSLFVSQHITSVTTPEKASTSELQRLLDARRYTLQIPAERDGWILSFESVVDGVPKQGGGSSVVGNTKVVLLLRKLPETRKLEYCWYTNSQLSRGLIDDPLVGAGVTMDRSAGPIKSGDWLLRGGRTSIQFSSPPDFEFRVLLRAPNG